MYIRKQVNQLPSKMRFVAAQFIALLDDDLWIRLAEHSNAMCERLYELTSRHPPGCVHAGAPEVNSVFPIASRRRHRAAAGLVASSGTGTSLAHRSAG